MADTAENAKNRKRAISARGITLTAAMFVLLIVGFFVFWNNGLRDFLFPKNFGIVEPGQLYRSGQISHWQIEPTLKKNHIQVIVALSAHGGKSADLDAELNATKTLGIDREIFPLGGDGTGQVQQYALAIAAIDRAKKQGKPVLVHCIAGAQRTGGVIATYEILVEHRSPAEAFKQMRSFGHDPTANPHLLEYLNQNIEPLARALVELHVIDKVPSPVPVIRAEQRN